MAVTIQQSPSSPAMANSDLIYVVTSTQISQPQFQFVCDILDMDDNLIQRIEQQPNPSGKGVFNLKDIIPNSFPLVYQGKYNSNNTLTDKGNYFTLVPKGDGLGGMFNPGIVKDLKIRFGEKYAASLTATPIYYNGNGSPGDPAVYATEWTSFLNGYLDYDDDRTLWYDGTKYYKDWDYSHNTSESLAPITIFGDTLSQVPGVSYDYLLTAENGNSNIIMAQKYYPTPNWGYFNSLGTPYVYDTAVYNRQIALTDLPVSSSMGRYDYLTLSFLNGSLNGKNGVLGQWPYYTIVDGKNAAGSTLRQWGAYNPLKRNNQDNSYFYASENSLTYVTSQSEDTRVITMPVGMKNWYDRGLTTSELNDFNDIDYLKVQTYGWSNETHNFPLNQYTGSGAGEAGTLAYSIPVAILDNTPGPTGTYPSSPFRFELFLTSGGGNTATLQVHVTESDAQFVGYPAASAQAIADAINTEWAASGLFMSTEIPLAHVYDWPNYEVVSSYGAAFNKGLVIAFPGLGSAGTVSYINSSSDAFGAEAFGNGSCTGWASGSIGTTGFNPYQVVETSTGVFEGLMSEYHIDIVDSCDYETKRFAWKNRWGAHDWWTFTLASSTTDNITREQYTKTNVDYNTSTNLVTKDLSDRGKTQFTNNIDKQYTVESDWVDDEVAQYLYDLFKSTDVYVQGEDDMLPVVITNTSVTEKTNPRTQKLYKFTVEYKMSNEERARK